MTITKAIYKYLDELPECILSGWQLYDVVVERTGRHPYPTTILNTCRKYADITGAGFVCVDHQSSQYRYTPGVAKLGDSPIFIMRG